MMSIGVLGSEEIESGEGAGSSGITMPSASSCRVLVFLNRQKSMSVNPSDILCSNKLHIHPRIQHS